MRVRLTAHHRLDGNVLPAGSVHELGDGLAKQLVRMGAAVKLPNTGRRPPASPKPTPGVTPQEDPSKPTASEAEKA